MTAQGEKPCAVFVWAAEAYGAGGDESLPCGSTRKRAVPEGRGPGMPGPSARRTFSQAASPLAAAEGVKTPPYNANLKRGMPLGRGRHICRPYKAAESPHSLILLSLRLPNQISKRFSLNFRKIFCFGIVKRRYLRYDADKNKDVPTRGLCVPCWERLLSPAAQGQMCDAARFNGIGKGRKPRSWKTLPSARPPPGCTARV